MVANPLIPPITGPIVPILALIPLIIIVIHVIITLLIFTPVLTAMLPYCRCSLLGVAAGQLT
jgi:hypothetical protein